MAGVPPVDEEHHQRLGAGVDAAVGPASGDVEGLAGADLLPVHLALGGLHQHHAVAAEAVVDLGGVQDGVKVALGHEILLPHLSGVEDGGAELEHAGVVFGQIQAVELIQQGVAPLHHGPGRRLIGKLGGHVGHSALGGLDLAARAEAAYKVKVQHKRFYIGHKRHSFFLT